MRWSLIVVGVVLFVVVSLDQLATIARTGGGRGFVLARLHGWVWRVALVWHRWRPSHRRLNVISVAMAVLVPVVWIVGLWVAWTCIFLASDTAVVEPGTNEPATSTGRAYFAGFNLFTLGLGDLHPGGDGWRIAAVLASIMGLTMITLSVTYLVPIVQAAVERRSLSRTLHQLDLLAHDAVGEAYDDVMDSLADVAEAANKSCEQHLTYAALRYYHAVEPEGSLAVQVAAAEEFLRRTADRGDRSRRRRRVEAALGSLGRAITVAPRADVGDAGGPVGQGSVEDDLVRRLLDHDGRSELADPFEPAAR